MTATLHQQAMAFEAIKKQVESERRKIGIYARIGRILRPILAEIPSGISNAVIADFFRCSPLTIDKWRTKASISSGEALVGKGVPTESNDVDESIGDSDSESGAGRKDSENRSSIDCTQGKTLQRPLEDAPERVSGKGFENLKVDKRFICEITTTAHRNSCSEFVILI
jgi:hypothetical protein